MYTAFQSAHSIFAYIVFALLFLASINAITGLLNKRIFTDKDLRISLFALIVTHLQLLLGIVLYFISPLGVSAMGEMKNSALRLTALEHPLMAVIAIVLVTIGWSKQKREESGNGKFKKIAIFYTLGLLLLASRLPWTNWFN